MATRGRYRGFNPSGVGKKPVWCCMGCPVVRVTARAASRHENDKGHNMVVQYASPSEIERLRESQKART